MVVGSATWHPPYVVWLATNITCTAHSYYVVCLFTHLSLAVRPMTTRFVRRKLHWGLQRWKHVCHCSRELERTPLDHHQAAATIQRNLLKLVLQSRLLPKLERMQLQWHALNAEREAEFKRTATLQRRQAEVDAEAQRVAHKQRSTVVLQAWFRYVICFAVSMST